MPDTNTRFSGFTPSSGSIELHRGEDPVVAAARAPAHLLVGLEVLAAQLHRACRHRSPLPSFVRQASSISRILLSSSAARNGRPCTLRELCASTRNSARTSLRQLAEVHLGHEHLRVARASTSPRSAGNGFRCTRCAWATCRPAARTRRTASLIAPQVLAPAEHEQLGAVVVVELDRRDVVGDAGDLGGADAHHAARGSRGRS